MKKTLFVISLFIILCSLSCFEIYSPPRDNSADPYGDNSCGPVGVPTVTTTPITGNLALTSFIGGTSAQGSGNVTCDGYYVITDRGLCWDTSVNPTISDSHTSGGTGTGSFNCNLTGLTQNTVYHVRAYATNIAGTGYGSDITFNSGWTFGTVFAGGHVFYNDGTGHGLVSATTDQSTGIIWAIVAYQTISVPGTLTTIGSGSANTDKIIAQNGAGITYAAGLARAYTGSGYSDWFLPSIEELHLMYTNLHLKGYGAFAGGGYWSSSEYTAYIASAQHFVGGNVYIPNKTTTLYVRAARAF